ncbi:MAG: putative toxin-antitoxin system toxin component, PIN family [Syntrophomonadaceae bacterium]|jgi:putative PIN family toxin of toxin-antitoxin system|nr:putative toxin-antitoxin system toxin component, PIN family [Syntrophomonadaceae bacterium]
MSLAARRVMFDTTIIISAFLNPQGNPYIALIKGAQFPYSLVLCDQIFDEIRRIFNRKFPAQILNMEKFLARLCCDMVTLTAEDEIYLDEDRIRDVTDRPILRAAIKAGVDIFVTGDKDFLESEILLPMILKATQFIQLEY